MHFQLAPLRLCVGWLLGLTLLLSPLGAQEDSDDNTPLPPGATDGPIPYEGEAAALHLARRYLQGGDDARVALLEALQKMGWGVRDAKGAVLQQPPANANTGLAMRDYEIEELLWNPADLPSIRLISYAQTLAVPLEGADPEELAQALVETVRQSAKSEQPQQRFWGQFLIALGRVGPHNYDLSASSPPSVIPPAGERLSAAQLQAMQSDPMALLRAMQPSPVWDDNDPVLAPSPRPERSDDDAPMMTMAERDEKRMQEISEEINRAIQQLAGADETTQAALQKRMQELGAEMSQITMRIQSASMQSMNQAMKAWNRVTGEDDDDDDEDEDDDQNDDEGPRFQAEWRDQPLSYLQVALLTRVFAADLRLAATRGRPTTGVAFLQALARPTLPLASMQLAQAAPAPSGPNFGSQFAGAAGDIWATGWGWYTGTVVEHYYPDSKFNKGVAAANAIMAWWKTIMTVARQNITVEVENAPLVRTKTRSPGERRTAKATVMIDFPKAEIMKAVRAAANLSSVNLQIPDSGPISGAKVVWRLTEGSYNNKYQTAKGGWAYHPEFAVVQFAQAGSKAAYVSNTDSNGVATITIEGVPQKKNLPNTVRPYPRRAAISVEVTLKVGNMTQDLTDAISLATGGPVAGSLNFLADMVSRTSFFFQKGRVFEVRDWKEPAWQGEFEITIKGSGSKKEKGDKGGPEVEYTWKMDRYMEGRMHTPDWAEEVEQERNYETDGRHKLEVDGDRRYFRLSDSSSAKSRNVYNRYEANGPLQIQPAGHNQLATYSRAEPSGSAELMFTGGMMQLTIQPFFGAECLVARSEKSGRRSSSRSGPEYLSLLEGVYPTEFTIIEQNDGSAEVIEGSKTFEYLGRLPYVPSFDVEVTVTYRLWKNNPPPKNRDR